jgi:hypothetical protein
MAGLNLFTNNAATTLASSILVGATSLTVTAGQGALFPTLAGSAYFYCTLSNTAGTTIEIVKVTARSTDTFTIVRAQDNTTASAFSAGDKVELRLTAIDLQNFPQLDSTNTFASAQTFSSAPIITPLSGLLKANTSSAITAATAGTDYLAPPSGTAILKANSGGALANATAGTDYGAPETASTWTASQRGTVTTDNDGSFDMSVTNNFKCTPTATFALTFTNITAGQSGYVLLVNTGGYAVTAAATTKVNTSFLTTVSAAGTYLLSYFTDGTNVYVTTGGAMA